MILRTRLALACGVSVRPGARLSCWANRGAGRRFQYVAAITAALLLTAAAPQSVHAQLPISAAFTYQGQLLRDGVPAEGSFSMRFELFDRAEGGASLGQQTLDAVAVTAGLFTVQLNDEDQFGPGAFNGEKRWLEVSVNDVTLTPRQELTATPHATLAASLALPFSGSAATPTPAFTVVNNGVGDNAWTILGSHGLSGNRGILGHPAVGAYGDNAFSGTYGGCGGFDSGVYGVFSRNENAGYLGGATYGAAGAFAANGNVGYLGGPAYGAAGVHGGTGRAGYLGRTAEGVYGVSGLGGAGVRGEAPTGIGVEGTGADGVWGISNALDGNGVRGHAHNGTNAYGVWGYSTSGWAGTFSGKVQVTGNFYAGAKFFRIDHPLDPERKFLLHACVESDQMKNVYDGVATLNEQGEARVELPPWFEALNRDFRYQLTCIGEPAVVYIKQAVADNAFVIAGGGPGLKVSWQVTGVRRDAYAVANPMAVEADKVGDQRGRYLHPEAFGLDASRSMEAERLQSRPSPSQTAGTRETTAAAMPATPAPLPVENGPVR